MSLPARDPRYEFSERENAAFSALAAAMTFVAIAMGISCVAAGGAAILLGRVSLAAAAILAPLVIVVAVMAVQLFRAANHLRRIARTRGSDIANLMIAVAEITRAYRLQSWLWIVVSLAIVMALATTIVGR